MWIHCYVIPFVTNVDTLQHAHRFFHLGVHVPSYLHCWGYIQIFGGAMYPLTLHLGGTKKMNCIFLISHVQFLYMLVFLSIWNKISICCCFECIIWTVIFWCLKEIKSFNFWLESWLVQFVSLSVFSASNLWK
jgi:hypothetical protein